MSLPPPLFVGFFPKITARLPDWLDNQSVTEICSVSNCISDGPEQWIRRWKHNEFGFFDDERLAYDVMDRVPSEFDLYAYKLFPLRCLGDKVEEITLSGEPRPLPADYDFLGYDIVTHSTSSFFECSPLSCNHAAEVYAVNEFCLIADQVAAYQTLLEISRAGTYEPGPYYLFEVYRKKKPGASNSE